MAATKSDPEIELALRSVADGPLDEGRKRVFTDLLLERGDPRGEFMLLQFVIASNQASGAVRQRAQELWQRHKKEWTKEISGVVSDLELENGFPVAGTVGKTAAPDQILRSAMFVTMKRLRANKDGQQLLIAAACDVRLTGLQTLEVDSLETFATICAKGVPGRLTKLTLRLSFGKTELELVRTSPVLSKLKTLTFQPVFRAQTQRRGLGRRLKDLFSPGADASALAQTLVALDLHPTLEHLELPVAGFGDLELFMQVAAAWPKLEFRRISGPGTFELEREEGGTLLVLQNFTNEQLVQLRPAVPKDVTRARLSRKRQWSGIDLEPVLKAWAPINVTMV
ncbi:MAG: hypothetical protein JNM17_19705 [Archangium sp.]|nr:hypothetical protein [Archangium sp.]